MTVLFPDDPRAIRGIRRKVPKVAEPLARMVDHWGAKCEDYEPECLCCKAWKLFDGKRFISDEEVV